MSVATAVQVLRLSIPFATPTPGAAMIDDFHNHKQFTDELLELRGRIAELEAWKEEHRWDADALKESEARFRNLTEKSTVGVYLIQGGVFLYANPRMAAIFGYEPDELIDDKELRDLVYPEDWHIVETNLTDDVSIDALPFNYQFRGLRKGGQVISVEVFGSTMAYGGRPTVIGTVLDITQRIRAETDLARELSKFQALYDLATAMTADHTLDENLSLVVETGRKLLAADTSYIALRDHKTADVYMHTLSGIETEAFRQLRIPAGAGLGGKVALTGSGFIVEDYFEEIEPTLHDIVRNEGLISGVAVPVQIGTTNLGVLYIFNRTRTSFSRPDLDTLSLLGKLAAVEIARKRTEDELRQARQELEERVQIRTAELRATNQKLSLEVTQRKRIEGQLRQSQERYRTLVEESFDGILVHRGADIIFANSRLHEMLEYDSGTLTGTDFWSICHPADRTIARKLGVARMQGEKVPFQYELRLLRSDGTFFDVEVNERLVEFRSGRAVQVCMRDITGRKKAEAALKSSEEKYRLVVENASDAIFVAQDGMLKFVNPKSRQIFGYSERELMSTAFVEFVHPDDRLIVADLHAKRLRKEPVVKVHAFRIVDRDANIKWLEEKAVLIDWGGRPATLNFASDVTARLRMESELLKMEKLESMGILAGGIAHDFNNIVTAMLGNISIAKMYLPSKDKVFERLSEAEKACLHAQSLTQQLLTFAKGGAPIKKRTMVSGIVKDSCQFALRGSNVRCEFAVSDNLWTVEVDRGQINQVLYNLVINAHHAMPDGGTIHVSSENTEVKPLDGLPLEPGKYVKISVQDHGIGIPKKFLAKIFDPYFTTKNRGSGLGLATSFSIIKNHGGLITVESDVGLGTKFHIYLPSCGQAEAPAESRDETILVGHGKILLMDDEHFIRDLAGEMLALLGYDVTLAKDGAQALELYETAMTSSNPFDLVIMDLTIPGGMGGSETIRLLRQLDPTVKAIVSSGYSNDPIMADYEKYGFSGVVAKPYSVNDLSETLTKVLYGGEKQEGGAVAVHRRARDAVGQQV
jgi:two-component system, cell cycle sensor histidine kinase and response regulator CckA